MDTTAIDQTLPDRMAAARLPAALPASSACICTPCLIRRNRGVCLRRDGHDLRRIPGALGDLLPLPPISPITPAHHHA